MVQISYEFAPRPNEHCWLFVIPESRKHDARLGSKSMPRSLITLPAEISRHKVLNTAEAAALLNFSIPHFRRLYRRGGVPAPIQLSSRKLGWRAGELVDWLASRQSRPIAA